MAVEKAEKSKPRLALNILPTLKMVATILAILVFIVNAVTNLMVVYMVFAPDDFPKPFYLVYYLPGENAPVIPMAQAATGEEATTAEGGTTTEGGTTSEGTITEPESPGISGEILPGQGILLDTGAKVVNLSDPTGRKFIRTNVVLEFAPSDPVYLETEAAVEEPAAAEGEGEAAVTVSARDAYIADYKEQLNARLPVINDVIISLLSEKTFDAVYTSQGKELLRQEIMQAVNSRTHGYRVIYVYFTEFVMQ